VWEHSGLGAYPGDWKKSIDNLAAAGFNIVIPNMLWAGVAHYASDLLPRSKEFEEYGDQIAQCVAAAHQAGIEVHPWKVNWNLSRAPKEFVQRMRAAGRTQVDVNGEPIDWLCPSHPANQQLEIDTMLEVVRKYDVDGVHFDYIRYPHGNACYCDGCRQRFEKLIGHAVADWPADVYSGPLRERYRQFRRDNISYVVREVSRRAHQLKPDIKISAAVFRDYPNCRDTVGQDWVYWIQQGWLDFVCPMDYTNDPDVYRNWVKTQAAYIAGKIPFYAGLGATLGQWRLTPDQIAAQINIARDNGADGFCIFNYSKTVAETDMPVLGAAITRGRARSPHRGP